MDDVENQLKALYEKLEDTKAVVEQCETQIRVLERTRRASCWRTSLSVPILK